MSSALIRQALAFVDPEESGKNGKNKRRARSAPYPAPGQGFVPNKRKSTKPVKHSSKPEGEVVEENVKKLLILSKPTASTAIAEKIVERAVKGKPLTEKLETKTEEEKSILFPEESSKEIDKEQFCS